MKRTLKLGLSLGVTGVCLWWSFKDTDWPKMWGSLEEANYGWLLPYVGILLGIHLCRTLRWGAWLSGIEKVPFRPLNQASGIGFMMLIVLPFRLGEFARPFLIAQRSRIRRSEAMTSVVLERIVDGIVIAALLRLLLFFVPSDSAEIRYVKWGANMMFLVFGGGLAFLLFALWHQQRAVALVRRTLGVVAPGAAEKVADVVERFVGATRRLPPPPQMVAFFFFTAAYWSLNGWGMSLLARAFDCQGSVTAQCVPLNLSLFQGFVVLSVLVVGLMVPAAPGSAGTFQAAVLIGLSIFLPRQVVESSGVAYANVLWLVQIGQQVLLGLTLMWLGGGSFTDLAGKLGEGQEAPPSQRAAAIATRPA